MKPIILLIVLHSLILQLTFSQISSAQKLIITITDDWNSSKATVYLFDSSKDGWKKQREEFSVSIGENGLGWGEGIHPIQQGQYRKHEGDKRSPAGIFELDTVFYGIDTSAPEGVRYYYRQLTEFTRCIDDSNSTAYNTIVEEDRVSKDWNSAEEMKNIVPDYQYVLVVKQNPAFKRGKGSCIFFHTNNVPTSGCTSMEEADMMSLLYWLDPKRKTLVIQLPHSEYNRLQTEWNLPKLMNQ